VLEPLRFLEDLEERDVEFVSVRDAIDTKIPTGRLALTMVAGENEELPPWSGSKAKARLFFLWPSAKLFQLLSRVSVLWIEAQ
jgi:hypothetical protein